MLQDGNTIEFKLDVKQDCRAYQALLNYIKIFLCWYGPKV